MKKILLFVLLTLFIASSVFAANEYTQFGINYGYSTLLESQSLGFHTLYQFGASLDDNFDFGFGTDMEIDISLSDQSTNNISFDLILGLATAVDLNESLFLNVTAGPCLTAYGKAVETKDEENLVAFGVGASAGLTLLPYGERNQRIQMGFTFGTTATALWTGDADLFKTKVNGFVALTLRGPMMFSYYDYAPSNIVW